MAEKHGSSSQVSKIRNANNTLYYAIEYLDVVDHLSIRPADGIKTDDILKHLDFLEKTLHIAKTTKQQLNFIVTLCRASVRFGKTPQAVAIAEHIEHLLSAPPPPPKAPLFPSKIMRA